MESKPTRGTYYILRVLQPYIRRLRVANKNNCHRKLNNK